MNLTIIMDAESLGHLLIDLNIQNILFKKHVKNMVLTHLSVIHCMFLIHMKKPYKKNAKL